MNKGYAVIGGMEFTVDLSVTLDESKPEYWSWHPAVVSDSQYNYRCEVQLVNGVPFSARNMETHNDTRMAPRRTWSVGRFWTFKPDDQVVSRREITVEDAYGQRNLGIPTMVLVPRDCRGVIHQYRAQWIDAVQYIFVTFVLPNGVMKTMQISSYFMAPARS